MTTVPGDSAAAGDGGFARDWDALRATGDIQFAPVKLPPPPETPGWLKAIGDFFDTIMRPVADMFGALGRALGMSGQAVMWVLVAVAVVAAAVLIARYLVPFLARRGEPAETPAEWSPDSGEALALLEDADRLAAEGRFDEATHLLLKRSVGQIAAARPGLLDPSSTAREIAALTALPEAARRAFATIAGRVERSLFALRSLSADDWHAARSAYAEFALATPVRA